ncbi:DUF1573 domain-containing protein [Vicingaceae bacterium]|jgi:hypothetical protein|nr:DUF1573 domain-containing protein [Vicingaceae bacterium]
MNNNTLLAIVAGIGLLTVVNTYMIFTNDNGVSYQQTEVITPTNNLAATPSNSGNMPAVVEENVGPKTSIQFTDMEHDFGSIDQDTKNTKVFTFTNTGNEPLIISDAKGSCGCTVPNYPRNPIAPGETGEIEVVYSPGKQVNQQTKTVSITANTEPATTVLRVKANVTPGEVPAEG